MASSINGLISTSVVLVNRTEIFFDVRLCAERGVDPEIISPPVLFVLSLTQQQETSGKISWS